MTTLPSALFNRLPRSRRRKERRRRRSRFLSTMAKTSVRRARTPHRGDAHNARLTPLHGGGKEQPRGRGWRAGAYAFCCCFVIPNFLSVIPNFLSVIPSFLSVIPNECEGSPCKRQGAGGGFLASLTSPLWGLCAALSECSCKQAFLLASGGMTVCDPSSSEKSKKRARPLSDGRAASTDLKGQAPGSSTEGRPTSAVRTGCIFRRCGRGRGCRYTSRSRTPCPQGTR